MSDQTDQLAALRQQIDRIDDQIHQLIIERADCVGQIRACKGDTGVYMRPGREAAIIRRLIEGHRGDFPAMALVRIWREIISALTLMQGEFSVAVYAPGDQSGLWDVARDHFGIAVPLLPVTSPSAVLRSMSEGAASVGVLPWPEIGEEASWWPALVSGDKSTFRVVGTLPFSGHGNGRGVARSGMMVAGFAPEPTGNDRTLLALLLADGISRDRLFAQIAAAGLEIVSHLGVVETVPRTEWLHLIELEGFHHDEAAALERLRDNLGEHCLRVDTIGAYPTPLTPAAAG